MTSPFVNPTLEEAAIKALARHARIQHILTQALSWTVVPGLLGMTYAVITGIVWHQHVGTDLFWRVVLPWGPLLSVGMCIAVDRMRKRGVRSKFSAVFATERGDALAGVSSSAIGPLLEMLMPGARNRDLLPVQAALLADLLHSVRATEEVVLTEDQRNVLHELVIVGRWTWFNLHDDKLLDEKERHVVRPSAIHALALFGNRSSIPVLERFARKTDDPALRQAALRSVEQIRERLRYGPAEMLRASRAPEHPETLLRAVSPDKPQARDSQPLLRSDNTDAELLGKNPRQQTEEQAASVAIEAAHGIKPK